MKLVFFLVIIIFFASCMLEGTPNKAQETPNRIDMVNCDSSWLESPSSQLYFPPNIFSSVVEDNQFVVDWYTTYLKAMKEPSLYEIRKHMNIEIYRFLTLSSEDYPLMIRLQRCDDKYLLVKKRLTGNRKENPGIIKEQKERKLSEIEWRQCINYLEKEPFWTLPVKRKEPLVDDGVKWILEGVKKGNYHIVDRQYPSTEFDEFFNCLLKLSDSVDSKEDVSGEKQPTRQ